MTGIESKTFGTFTNVQGDIPYDFSVVRRLSIPDQVGGIWDPNGHIHDSNVAVYQGLGDVLGMVERHPAFRNATFDTLNSFEEDLRLLTAGFVLTIGTIYGLYHLDEGIDSEKIAMLGKHVNASLKLAKHNIHPDLTGNMLRLKRDSKIMIMNEGQVVWEHSPR